jgi:glycosyltransferase involved in cell wall biosynthesis
VFNEGASPRVVLLTNVIPPYHKPVFDRLAHLFPHLRILLSTPMERNRSWKLDWGDLDVVVQNTITLNRMWRHPRGFSEPLYIHLPLDTLTQLKRFQADIVISWEMGVRTLLSAIYRLTHRSTRLIIWAETAEATEHGRGLIRGVLRRMIHRAADAFLVTGDSGARYLRSLGICDRKIFKIAYTTDIRPFLSASITRNPESAARLLYVGQLIERKGLLQFLEVLSRWAALHWDREVEFRLAGSGPLREKLKSFATPPNLKLIFLGNVDYQELPAVYAEAGIFVLPSLADTWAVVVNEAMAAGLPILGSSYAQAVSELVQDGLNGWTFRPDAGDEMSEALDRCMHATLEELDKMRLQARATAVRLTPDYVTSLIEQAILSVAERQDAHSVSW